MNDRNAHVICFIVILLSIAVGVGIYYGHNMINELMDKCETLTNEYNGLNKETNMMAQRKKAFEDAFTELAKFKVNVGGNVDFYSEAQKAISKDGAKVIENSKSTTKDGRISMKMTFTGDYYSIIKAFAELRGLPNVVRVITVNLASTNNKDTSVNSDIKADILIEALANSGK